MMGRGKKKKTPQKSISKPPNIASHFEHQNPT